MFSNDDKIAQVSGPDFVTTEQPVLIADADRPDRPLDRIRVRLQPPVVVLDVVLPDRDGFAVAESIGLGGAAHPPRPRPRIVFHTLHDGPRTRERAERLGAALVPKGPADEPLLVAIREGHV